MPLKSPLRGRPEKAFTSISARAPKAPAAAARSLASVVVVPCQSDAVKPPTTSRVPRPRAAPVPARRADVERAREVGPLGARHADAEVAAAHAEPLGPAVLEDLL